MENKTHYRKVFKSDHLGVPDLEDLVEQGQKLIFTIREVKQEVNVSVAGRKGNHNIAYFKEQIKPLVLNATNAKIVKKFTKVEEYTRIHFLFKCWNLWKMRKISCIFYRYMIV